MGTGVSTLGIFAASCAGYALGRAGWTRKFFKPEEPSRIEQHVAALQVVTVILTRPLPLLAEATSILAGVQRMSFPTFAAASVAGATPTAILYAVIGSGISQNQSSIIFILVYLIIAVATFSVAKFFEQKSAAKRTCLKK